MIREIKKDDAAKIEELHERSGFDYRLPNLDDPLFVTKLAVEEGGHLVQAIALKLEAEVYLWVDPSWGTPEERWRRFVDLTYAAKLEAYRKGLDALVCVVPPELERRFGKRLEEIGMTRDRAWQKYSFDLSGFVPRVESEVEVT